MRRTPRYSVISKRRRYRGTAWGVNEHHHIGPWTALPPFRQEGNLPVWNTTCYRFIIDARSGRERRLAPETRVGHRFAWRMSRRRRG